MLKYVCTYVHIHGVQYVYLLFNNIYYTYNVVEVSSYNRLTAESTKPSQLNMSMTIVVGEMEGRYHCTTHRNDFEICSLLIFALLQSSMY